MFGQKKTEHILAIPERRRAERYIISILFFHELCGFWGKTQAKSLILELFKHYVMKRYWGNILQPWNLYLG